MIGIKEKIGYVSCLVKVIIYSAFMHIRVVLKGGGSNLIHFHNKVLKPRSRPLVSNLKSVHIILTTASEFE